MACIRGLLGPDRARRPRRNAQRPANAGPSVLRNGVTLGGGPRLSRMGSETYLSEIRRSLPGSEGAPSGRTSPGESTFDGPQRALVQFLLLRALPVQGGQCWSSANANLSPALSRAF